MALSDMTVFNQYVQPAVIETLAQMVDKFNGASNGAIRLTTEGFSGDFLQESFWASIHSAQRRVDRYAAQASASATDLSQIKASSVKVAGGFGPIRFEPSQLTWLQKPTAEGIEVISRNLAEAMMKDMLNSSIAALVAAIEAQGADTVHDGGTDAPSFRLINSAHAKFGDMSNSIVCNVMDGVTYHELIDNALANAERLFEASNVLVLDVLGRAIVVTDAPALREAEGAGNDQKILGLVPDAAVVHDAGDLITNIETSNGQTRIETTMQADYTFGLGLKGYTWDEANGGKSPLDAEIATGSNWDKVATSIKHTAGVLAITDL
jgi:hypothetical protein